MNRYRRELEENGVTFQSNRSNGKRILSISYTDKSDDSDVKDDKITAPENVVNIVPVVPERAALARVCNAGIINGSLKRRNN